MGTPLQGRFKSSATASGGSWSGANNITRSAWLDGSADYLSRSSVTGTSTRKWSIFGAFRITDFSARNRHIFECSSGTSSQTTLLLRPEQDLQFFDYSGGALNAVVYSDGLIRDSEWYTFLCVCDTANSTEEHRWRLYLNAVEQTAVARTNPGENHDTAWNNGTTQYIGAQGYGSVNHYWEGSITAMLHADNTVLTPSDVWASDTVGTNGTVYYPKSESDLTALANAGGTASFFLCSDIGDGTDDSSKGNNFTASSMSDAANGSNDTPTDPLPIFNPLFRGGNNVFFEEGGAVGGSSDSSEANLLVVTPGFYSGKHVIEFDITNNTSGYPKVGLMDAATMRDDSVHATSGSHQLGAAAVPGSYGYDPSGLILHEGSTIDSSPATFTTNDHIAIEVDLDSDVIRWYKGGSLQSTTSSAGLEAPVFFAIDAYNGSDARIIAEVADMTHSPTTGYTPLKYSNLAAPTAQGADVFQVLTYSGNASTQSITGAGFQPDLIWGKDRAASSNFELYDSSRGTTKVIYSSSSTSEGTVSGVTAFNSDGFSLGSDAGINASGNNQVAWCWKANAGTTSSNGDGDISSTVQVGDFMSIVQYTGNATASQTVGHGLGAAPDMIITKNRDASTVALAWFNSFSAQYLNLTNTSGVSSGIYGSTMNSTVFEVESNSEVNGSGNNMIAYCFKNLPGVCQVGKYIGNGDADGPMLNLGFEGRWIVIKTSSTGGWACFDTARDTAQPLGNWLQLDSAAAESTTGLTVDALATGFKVRDTHSWLNSSGTTYHYIAFADVATGIGLPPILGK